MYDAIIAGARCAGSATAMLLARKGYRVLLADKAAFPSDTISGHFIHQPGVAKLRRWGLLDKVIASGCPPVRRHRFDVGPFALSGAPPECDGVADGYAPRRTILDKILLDAAMEAGVEVRENFPIEELVFDGGRVTGIRCRSGDGFAKESARIVIGADGAKSGIARLVGAPKYDEQPAHSCAYYSYFSCVPVEVAELYLRPERVLVSAPTNDGLTMVAICWPEAEFPKVRADLEGEFMRAVDMAPCLSKRLRAGTRVEKIRGSMELGGFFRKPYGPGWALVGDAGYHKNPITAQGITDAFRDAELLSDALDEAFSGRSPEEVALEGYERTRNEAALPMYYFTCDLAKLSPPQSEIQSLFEALRGNEEESGRFLGTIAGTTPILEYFSPENLARIVGVAKA